ncbi:hypothetical protein STRDD11_00524 [Streptococcus sp. DD11]|nr:hypothetical protein [Streptococcus sp. DD11]KXT85117.1 hypothetical protein STRDD11_00524 [Streptococcus sp. DD11]
MTVFEVLYGSQLVWESREYRRFRELESLAAKPKKRKEMQEKADRKKGI